MCGIAGLVGLPVELARRRVSEALTRIQHRGPNGQGQHRAPAAVLGMCRLAVIDVEGGNQPIYNEDRSLAVVCNGEIYNYRELFADLRSRGHRLQSDSDINVIPHLMEEEGRLAVRHWRGMFAAAVWNERTQELTLFRDRLGKKPLFYAQVRGGLAFASELPALLALLDKAPAHNPAALREYLRLGFVPHPLTIYDQVHVLPPACSLTFTPGGAPQVQGYWDRSTPPPFDGMYEDALRELAERFREAVSLRLRSDIPLGMFLSGGIDSGLVASFAAEAGASDLLCFVVDTGAPKLSEVALAQRTAAKCGLPCQVIPLEMNPRKIVEKIALLYGQPFADSSAVPSFLVAQEAAKVRSVVLNGDGGDEVFAGYRRHLLPRWLHGRPWPGSRALGNLLAHGAGRRSGMGFLARALRGMGETEEERYLAWSVDLLDQPALARIFPGVAAGPAAGAAVPRKCNTLREFLWTDTRLILADDLLSKMDIATMAHGLEARSPFLDIPLLEFSWSLPESWILPGFTTKPLLRRLAATRLPAEVITAPKKGFEVPVARWLQHELRDLVNDVLLAPGSQVARMSSAPELAAFVQGRDRFEGNRAQATWMLLMLELFLRARTPPPASK